MAVANEAVVKRVNYIWEMSQKDGYFNRIGVTKRSSGCTVMFHFDNVSKSSTILTVQKHWTENHININVHWILYSTASVYIHPQYTYQQYITVYNMEPMALHPFRAIDFQISSQSESQKNRFSFISFGKIQFYLPVFEISRSCRIASELRWLIYKNSVILLFCRVFSNLCTHDLE